MAKVKFKVRQDLYKWGCDHGVFESGQNPHEVNASKEFAAQIAAAEAHGSLVEVKWEGGSPPKGAVESQADSIKKLDKAMADGSWQEGNYLQAGLDAKARDNVEIGGNS
ncbi:MAG: hypothetical protein H0U18_09915 [Pyrinomonadaceae bacterium]|nr:hypothetical protein [Pyrinomonadaceae bacterium]